MDLFIGQEVNFHCRVGDPIPEQVAQRPGIARVLPVVDVDVVFELASNELFAGMAGLSVSIPLAEPRRFLARAFVPVKYLYMVERAHPPLDIVRVSLVLVVLLIEVVVFVRVRVVFDRKRSEAPFQRRAGGIDLPGTPFWGFKIWVVC